MALEKLLTSAQVRDELGKDPRFAGVPEDIRETLFRAYVRELAEAEEESKREEYRRRREAERYILHRLYQTI